MRAVYYCTNLEELKLINCFIECMIEKYGINVCVDCNYYFNDQMTYCNGSDRTIGAIVNESVEGKIHFREKILNINNYSRDLKLKQLGI